MGLNGAGGHFLVRGGHRANIVGYLGTAYIPWHVSHLVDLHQNISTLTVRSR